MRKGEIFHAPIGYHSAWEETYDHGESVWRIKNQASLGVQVTGNSESNAGRMMFLRSLRVQAAWRRGAAINTNMNLQSANNLTELWEVFHFATKQKLYVKAFVLL